MAIQDTLPLPLEVILPVIAAIASFTVAGIYTAWVAKQKPGTKEMLEISEAVRQGAAAFLRREMRIIIPIAIGLSVIIGFSALLFSVFVPVQIFGILVMGSISLCLFGALATLPALISLINPKFLYR